MTPQTDNPKTVLVTGATGNQGNALARKLIERGHNVLALTRDPSKPEAKELANAGAKLVQGDFDDPKGIEQAAQGADVAFVMATPFEAGMETETQQGIAAVDAVVAGGVGHVVYASVANADQETGIPHFESKVPIEEHVQGLDTPWTIVGPVFFMENLLSPWFLPPIKDGNVALALPEDKALQVIAVDDIGAFVTEVIEGGAAFHGKRVDIAGDELTGPEMARFIGQAAGRDIGYAEIPREAMMEQSEDFGLMFQWFDEVGYSVDIAALKSKNPAVGWTGFKAWANAQDWSVLDE